MSGIRIENRRPLDRSPVTRPPSSMSSRYNMEILNGYGIGLRPLAPLALQTYEGRRH